MAPLLERGFAGGPELALEAESKFITGYSEEGGGYSGGEVRSNPLKTIVPVDECPG